MKYLFAAAVLVAGTFASFSAANAAGGCGPGWHRGPYGGCQPNRRAVVVRPAPVVVAPPVVVVRPGRLFTNSRWASILGYRMSLRYFGDLDTTNFALKPPLTNQTPPYTQKGEFVWGAAAFIDGVAAVELLGDLFR